ncbi:ATP-grasp domain-containing protein [Portibacter marinus]|uniref:ATP-grasp domain-containing protein n=1 Tax=Portibacter marinus TaxID=2898660 RepID=UPI001F1F7F82|nr:ATPase [Portibacter marinus]
MNFLCICTYFKGQDFFRYCKREGNNVYLLTRKKLENEAWPWESIDEVFYIEEWNHAHVVKGIAYTFRSIKFDRFVALDDFDVERVALLREDFRMPGMGDTTGRLFRDKLAMRKEAKSKGIKVPEFTALFNDEEVNHFIDRVEGPWLIKPRSEASAAGIKKIHSKEELWQVLHNLGDERHLFVLEHFAPGDVYHVDSLNFDNKVVFARVSKYLDTPYEVAHSGGIFRSMTLQSGSEEEKDFLQMNAKIMKAFGLKHGASHTEFIKSKSTGELYFLETSSRVGGANIAEMIEIASGINLWGEWARIETAALKGKTYDVPKHHQGVAGIVVSLSRYEYPDTSAFNDPEIKWRMNKRWHIGFIVQHDSEQRVRTLLDEYTERIARGYHASAKVPDKLE